MALEEYGPDQDSATNLYLAQVSNYTDRPDLFIAEIEKHDPGFIKRMNAASEENATTQRNERFSFGKRQAYSGLVISVIAAVSLLLIVAIAVWKGQGFWNIIALALLYAITQGGTSGFSRLIEGIQQMLQGKTKPDRDD